MTTLAAIQRTDWKAADNSKEAVAAQVRGGHQRQRREDTEQEPNSKARAATQVEARPRLGGGWGAGWGGHTGRGGRMEQLGLDCEWPQKPD